MFILVLLFVSFITLSNYFKNYTFYDNNQKSFEAGYKAYTPSKAFFEGIFGCIRPFISFLSTKSNIDQNQKEINEEFDVPFEELKNLQWLGSGAQGCVFKGTFKSEEVAIKKVKSKEEANIKHLKRLNHPNLVKFIGVSYNGDTFYCIVMEYCPFGQLYTYLNNIKDNNYLKPSLMLDWAKQIAFGMHYLHQNKIIHRDLKSPKYLHSIK